MGSSDSKQLENDIDTTEARSSPSQSEKQLENTNLTDKKITEMPSFPSQSKTRVESNSITPVPTQDELRIQEQIDKRLQKRNKDEAKIKLANDLQFAAKANSALVKVGVSVATALGSTGIGLPIAAPLLGIILIASLLIKKYAALIKLRQVFEDVLIITSRIFLLFTILSDGYKKFELVMNEELQINIQVKLDFVIAYLNKKFAKEMAEAMEDSQNKKGGGISSSLSSIKRSISSKASHVSNYVIKKKKFLDLYANASKIQNELITELTLINGYFVLIYTELELSLKEIEYGEEKNDLNEFKGKMLQWTKDYKIKLGTPVKTLINEITNTKIDPKVIRDFGDGVIKDQLTEEKKEEVEKEKVLEIEEKSQTDQEQIDQEQIDQEQKLTGGYYDLQNNRIRKSLYSNISKLRQKLLKRRNKYLTRNRRIHKRITRKAIRK